MSLNGMNFFGNPRNLSMSKNRSKKIMITEEAIKKVPYIEYEDIPESEYGKIQNFAKTILRVAKDENDSNEIAITYSYDSEFVGKENSFSIFCGTEHDVDLMADADTFHMLTRSKECAVISLHNHPSLSLISLADSRFFLYYSSIKLLAVVSNLGSISYLLKGRNFNLKVALELINQAITLNNKASNLKERQQAASFFLKNCYKAGIIYKNGR